MDGEMSAEARTRSKRLGLWIAGGLVLVALPATALVTTAIGGSVSPAGNGREAVAQCEGFADSRLKSPASADYDLSASQSGETWTVSGTVDSQNGFGALVRSNVTCVLHFEDDTAYLDDIAII